jgi:hypothetical protein
MSSFTLEELKLLAFRFFLGEKEFTSKVSNCQINLAIGFVLLLIFTQTKICNIDGTSVYQSIF